MSSSDKCLLICFIQFSFLFSSLLLSSIFWLLTSRQMYHKYCPSFCRIFSNCWFFHLLYKLFYFHEILLVYFCFFWCALERLSCSYQYPEFFFLFPLSNLFQACNLGLYFLWFDFCIWESDMERVSSLCIWISHFLRTVY